jgi:hypothetical protein
MLVFMRSAQRVTRATINHAVRQHDAFGDIFRALAWKTAGCTMEFQWHTPAAPPLARPRAH